MMGGFTSTGLSVTESIPVFIEGISIDSLNRSAACSEYGTLKAFGSIFSIVIGVVTIDPDEGVIPDITLLLTGDDDSKSGYKDGFAD